MTIAGPDWLSLDGQSRHGCHVTKIRCVVACSESGQYWEQGVEPAKCTSDDHSHRTFELTAISIASYCRTVRL